MKTSRRPEYTAWTNMIQRCHNKRCPRYGLYGGRGIFVCEEWINSFEKFYDHVGPRPDSSWCLDRVDNDLGYKPGNVRWTTKSVNQRNKRDTITVALWGSSVSLADIADVFEINKRTLQFRMKRRGLSWQDAVRWKKNAHAVKTGLGSHPECEA